MWNRVLSAAEVAQLYGGGAGLAYGSGGSGLFLMDAAGVERRQRRQRR